jgi:DNA-binding protein H-NS
MSLTFSWRKLKPDIPNCSESSEIVTQKLADWLEELLALEQQVVEEIAPDQKDKAEAIAKKVFDYIQGKQFDEITTDYFLEIQDAVQRIDAFLTGNN